MGEAIDLVDDPEAALLLRHPVQVEGGLTLSTATEVGGLFARFLPLLASQATTGSGGPDLSASEIAELMMAPSSVDHTHIFELDGDVTSKFLLPVRPACLYGGAVMDDLEGEATIFGVVERLIPVGSSCSLERYVLPGMNRTLRRAFPRDKLLAMLESLSDTSGGSIAADGLDVDGPAAVVTPLAIF